MERHVTLPDFPYEHSDGGSCQVISATSKFTVCWSLLITMFDIVYTPFILPIAITFGFESDAWIWTDIAVALFLTANLLINLATGYVVYVDYIPHTIVLWWTSVKLYVRHGTFIVDLVSSVPLLVVQLCLLTTQLPPQVVLPITAIRFLRIYRIMDLIVNRKYLTALPNWSPSYTHCRVIFIATFLYVGAAVVNVLACLWFGIARWQGYEDTWISHAQLDPYPNASNYIASVYFTLSTLTTVGYGDITATNTLERGVAMIIMITGVGFFLVFIGIIGDLFVSSGYIHRANATLSKLSTVNRVCRTHKIAHETRKEIHDFYIRNEHNTGWSEMLGDLPGSLRVKIIGKMISSVLQYIPSLYRLDKHSRKVLYANAIPVPILYANQEICFIGQHATHAILLIEGTMELTQHQPHNKYTISAPSLLLEFDIAECGYYNKKITTIDHCIVFKIPNELLDDLCV